MADAAQRQRPRLSVELFRGFLESRPDEERWELIDGVAVMMAPPTLAHQMMPAICSSCSIWRSRPMLRV